MKHRAQTSGERGLSVVELLATLALMGMVTLLAATLWDRAAVLIGTSQRSLRDPTLTLALCALRTDVQHASRVLGGGDWSTTPLELEGPGGATIRYTHQRGALIRSETTAAGDTPGGRTLVLALDRWRWRTPVADVVDVELTVMVHADPWLAAQRQGPMRRYEVLRRSEGLRLALRSTAGGGSW